MLRKIGCLFSLLSWGFQFPFPSELTGSDASHKQIGNINILNDGNLFSVCIYITFYQSNSIHALFIRKLWQRKKVGRSFKYQILSGQVSVSKKSNHNKEGTQGKWDSSLFPSWCYCTQPSPPLGGVSPLTMTRGRFSAMVRLTDTFRGRFITSASCPGPGETDWPRWG